MGVYGENARIGNGMQVMVSDCPGDHVNVIAASPVRGHHGTLAIGRRLGCLC